MLAVRGGRLVFHDARSGRRVRLDIDRIDGRSEGPTGSTSLTADLWNRYVWLRGVEEENRDLKKKMQGLEKELFRLKEQKEEELQ